MRHQMRMMRKNEVVVTSCRHLVVGVVFIGLFFYRKKEEEQQKNGLVVRRKGNAVWLDKPDVACCANESEKEKCKAKKEEKKE